MHQKWTKRAVWAVILGLGIGGLVWFAWPAPLAVDLAVVAKGPMEVTVDGPALSGTLRGCARRCLFKFSLAPAPRPERAL
jgi:hypothetical protein